MQDQIQQTIVISQRRSQKTLTEQAASKTKGNAANEAMEAATQALERQEEAKRLCETVYNEAIKGTLEKTEVLEKRVKTVTLRAEPLATTEADFFKTRPDRQQETQKHLHDTLFPILPDPLHSKKRSAQNPLTCTRLSAHEVRKIVPACQVRRGAIQCSPERSGKDAAMLHR